MSNNKQSVDRDEIEKDLFDNFVPKLEKDNLEHIKIISTGSLDLLREDELKEAMKGTLNGKAPGVDSISNLVIKHLIKRDGQYISDLYNLFIRHTYFPKCWKKGKLILFQKPGKKLNNAKSLRLITLLTGFGELL